MTLVLTRAGFIQQFGTVVKGKHALDSHWVSIWGGCSSAGNFVSQFLIVYVNDIAGRRAGLWVTWVLLLTVSCTKDGREWRTLTPCRAPSPKVS